MERKGQPKMTQNDADIEGLGELWKFRKQSRRVFKHGDYMKTNLMTAQSPTLVVP